MKMGEARILVLTLLVLTAACVKMVNCERRIILVGKDGSGKTKAGNIILGKEVFKNTFPKNACQCKKSEGENGERISIVTGLGEDLKNNILKCVVSHSFPGPHAFLLVINVNARSTLKEEEAVKWIEDNFGSDASMYTILLFTHTDLLEGKSLDQYISESEHLRRLKHQCGGRYHAFNNQLKDRSQVSELLQKIDKMVQENGGKHYTNDMYEEAQRRIDEARKRAKEEQKRKKLEEEKRIRQEEGEKYCKIMAVFAAGLLTRELLSSPVLAKAGAALVSQGLDSVLVKVDETK